MTKFEISMSDNIMLRNWFARKNFEDTVIFDDNIYNWSESGSYDYWHVYSPPIWKYTLQARQADQRPI